LLLELLEMLASPRAQLSLEIASGDFWRRGRSGSVMIQAWQALPSMRATEMSWGGKQRAFTRFFPTTRCAPPRDTFSLAHTVAKSGASLWRVLFRISPKEIMDNTLVPRIATVLECPIMLRVCDEPSTSVHRYIALRRVCASILRFVSAI